MAPKYEVKAKDRIRKGSAFATPRRGSRTPVIGTDRRAQPLCSRAILSGHPGCPRLVLVHCDIAHCALGIGT